VSLLSPPRAALVPGSRVRAALERMQRCARGHGSSQEVLLPASMRFPWILLCQRSKALNCSIFFETEITFFSSPVLGWGLFPASLGTPRLVPPRLLGDSELIPPGWMGRGAWAARGPAGDPQGVVSPGDSSAVLTGSAWNAAAGARREGKARFALPGRAVQQCRLGISVPCPGERGCRGALCPRGGEAPRAEHQPWLPGSLPGCLPLCLGSLGEEDDLGEANGRADVVTSKLLSFAKLLCANVAFVAVLSSERLLCSICIGLPKVAAFTS